MKPKKLIVLSELSNHYLSSELPTAHSEPFLISIEWVNCYRARTGWC